MYYSGIFYVAILTLVIMLLTLSRIRKRYILFNVIWNIKLHVSLVRLRENNILISVNYMLQCLCPDLSLSIIMKDDIDFIYCLLFIKVTMPYTYKYENKSL